MNSRESISPRPWRLCAIALLLVVVACGQTDCGGCMVPLEAGFPEEAKTGGVAQIRLSAAGVTFLSEELPAIIQTLSSIPCDPALPAGERVPCPAGLTCQDGNSCVQGGVAQALVGFRIPRSEGGESGCYERTIICNEASNADCLAYLDIATTRLGLSQPASINVDVGNRAWSTWIPTRIDSACSWSKPWCCGVPAPDCKIRIRDRNREMRVGVNLRTDNPLQRLEVVIGDPDIPLDNDDIEIDGHFGCDVIDFILPVLFPLFKGSLRDALNKSVKEAANEQIVESCDGAGQPPAQCTSSTPSWCDGDKLCHFQGNNRYLPALMGAEGMLDLQVALGAFADEAVELAFSVGAGGYAEVVAGGVEVGMRGGTLADTSTCVPDWSTPLPEVPRLVFPELITPPQGGGDPVAFKLGVAISDRMLEEALRKLAASGALCAELDAGLSSFINTGALSLLAPSLGQITRGGAKPALIQMLPRAPFSVDYGLGTTAVAPDDPDRTILEQPLLTVRARDLDLDLYAYVQDRYTRFMTMRLDLKVGLGVAEAGPGKLMLVVSDTEDWIDGIEILNHDLLTDPIDDIEAAVPALISAMTGQLAPALNQEFDLPKLAGFMLEDLIIRGYLTRQAGGQAVLDPDGNQVYEFLGVFANLSFDPSATGSPLHFAAETRVRVDRFEVPSADRLAAPDPEGRSPLLVLEVEVIGREGTAAGEFTYRVDSGFWRPFHRGQRLHVVDPVLRFMGRHRVEVRGRIAGEPTSLDPSPEVVELLVDPLPPVVEALHYDEVARLLTVDARDGITAAGDLIVRHRTDGGGWNTQRGLTPVAIEKPGFYEIEVAVLDEAGNVGRAVLTGTGDSRPVGPAADGSDVASATGCATMTGSGPVPLVGVLVCLWVGRRQRAVRAGTVASRPAPSR